MVIRSLFIAFVLLAAGIAGAQSIRTSAKVDSASYLIGDYIKYSIRVQYDQGVEVLSPSLESVRTPVEIIRVDEPVLSRQNDKNIVTYNYIAAVYDSADVTIPAIPVRYIIGRDTSTLTAFTNPVSFTVHSLEVEMGKEIKDVKDPIRIPLDWRIVGLWILGILLFLVLLFFLYIKFFRKKKQVPVKRTIPKVPAFVVALNALNELEKEKLWQSGHVKEYHSKITEIIRRYFEDRFNLPALELTTSESISILKERYDTHHILQVTSEFLQNADLVKFAKYIPLNSVNEEMMKQAYQIVEQTIPADKTENTAGKPGGREHIHV